MASQLNRTSAQVIVIASRGLFHVARLSRSVFTAVHTLPMAIRGDAQGISIAFNSPFRKFTGATSRSDCRSTRQCAGEEIGLLI